MSVSGVQRLVTLPPAPESARHARRFVTDVCTAAGAGAFVDVAALLTSELVTNGIVHAHTELLIVAEATAEWVRVEVADGSPLLPARRDYDEDALTGRGMEMVELLSDDYGVVPLGADGKRVWFRLGAAPAPPPAAVGGAPTLDNVVPVRLRNVPVVLYVAWQAHADAMLREATLAALDGGDGSLPGDYTLAGQALSALAAATTELFTDRQDASSHVDVEVPLPTAVLPYFPVLRDVLRTCTELAAAGRLLVPPSLPEIEAVRNWVCAEVGRQAQGLPPHPWTALEVDYAPPGLGSAEAVADVRAATTAVIAADRANRIIAVSAGAARLLGWSAGELEGHRLVTIIPARFRDAHIAGFTRQMLGGATHIPGRGIDVFALHRDGTEVPVTLQVERQLDQAGRPLFVATLVARG